MLAPSSGLLRAGLALKLNQIKLATRSYLRDRTNQATGTVTSYAVAAGLFAAAGIFLIAACLVGITALFRWIEINYGLFPAFGAVGALAAGDRRDLRRPGRQQTQAPAAALSRPSPAVCASPSRPIRSSPTRSRPPGIPPRRSCGLPRRPCRRSRRTRQSRLGLRETTAQRAGRPDLDGDLAGLGGRATAAGATNGSLMSGRRSDADRQSAPDRGHHDPGPDRAALFSADHARESALPAGRCRRRSQRFRAANYRSPATDGLSGNPFQIPWAGWKDILWRTYVRTGEDRLLATAAGVVFFGLLAVFPADHGAGLVLRPVRQSLDHRRQSADAGADVAGRLVPDRAGPDRPRARQGQHRARRDLPVRPRACDLERQCRRQGGDRRPQRRL